LSDGGASAGRIAAAAVLTLGAGAVVGVSLTRDPDVALWIAAVTAASAALSFAVTRAWATRLTIVAVLVLALSPLAVGARERMICESVHADPALDFVLSDCDARGSFGGPCWKTLKGTVADVAVLPGPRYFVTLCDAARQWSVVGPDGIDVGTAPTACARIGAIDGATYLFEGAGDVAARRRGGEVEALRHRAPTAEGTRAVALDPTSGDLLTLDAGAGVVMWDRRRGAPRIVDRTIGPAPFGALAVGADGTLYVSADETVIVRRNDGTEVRHVVGARLRALAVDDARGTLYGASTEEPGLRAWDAATLAPRTPLEGPSGLDRILVDPARDVVVASGSRPGSIHAWTASTGGARWSHALGPGALAATYDPGRGEVVAKGRCGLVRRPVER